MTAGTDACHAWSDERLRFEYHSVDVTTTSVGRAWRRGRCTRDGPRTLALVCTVVTGPHQRPAQRNTEVALVIGRPLMQLR